MEFSINDTTKLTSGKGGNLQSGGHCGHGGGDENMYSLQDIKLLVDSALVQKDPVYSAKVEKVITDNIIHNIMGGEVEKLFELLRPKKEEPVRLFSFIHPSISDEAERLRIHNEVVNVFAWDGGIQEMCEYLEGMARDKKIMLPLKHETAFAEFHRLGMPDETHEGFSKKNFDKFYGRALKNVRTA